MLAACTKASSSEIVYPLRAQRGDRGDRFVNNWRERGESEELEILSKDMSVVCEEQVEAQSIITCPHGKALKAKATAAAERVRMAPAERHNDVNFRGHHHGWWDIT